MLLSIGFLLVPQPAQAIDTGSDWVDGCPVIALPYNHVPLQCREQAWFTFGPEGGVCPGTRLLDIGTDTDGDGSVDTGVCANQGPNYVFSTVMCQFIVVINYIMGKFVCSLQFAIAPIMGILFVVYITTTGAQILMGSTQLNTSDLISRILKLTLVYWIVVGTVDNTPVAVYYVFDFMISFIFESTSWTLRMLESLPADEAVFMTSNPANDIRSPVTAFNMIDEMIYNSLTYVPTGGSPPPMLIDLSQEQGIKLMGFFFALMKAMPTFSMWVIAFVFSILVVFMRALVSFLVSILAVCFLLGLSPIFVSFMLFQTTFQFFDTWLRFVVSYCLQVMITFALLTMYLYSLTFFAPFLGLLADLIFPVLDSMEVAPQVWTSVNTFGVCPLGDLSLTTIDGITRLVLECQDTGFDPVNNLSQMPQVIPPSKIPELPQLIFFMFYHMISMVLVSYGFATLLQNVDTISRQLAGPAWVTPLNRSSVGNNTFGSIARGTGRGGQFIGTAGRSDFNRRHGTLNEYANKAHRGVNSYIDQLTGALFRRT